MFCICEEIADIQNMNLKAYLRTCNFKKKHFPKLSILMVSGSLWIILCKYCVLKKFHRGI